MKRQGFTRCWVGVIPRTALYEFILLNTISRGAAEFAESKKFVPIKEKDLTKHIEPEKKIKKEEDVVEEKSQETNTDSDDFQLYMGLQMLKGWEALRGK